MATTLPAPSKQGATRERRRLGAGAGGGVPDEAGGGEAGGEADALLDAPPHVGLDALPRRRESPAFRPVPSATRPGCACRPSPAAYRESFTIAAS